MCTDPCRKTTFLLGKKYVCTIVLRVPSNQTQGGLELPDNIFASKYSSTESFGFGCARFSRPRPRNSGQLRDSWQSLHLTAARHAQVPLGAVSTQRSASLKQQGLGCSRVVSHFPSQRTSSSNPGPAPIPTNSGLPEKCSKHIAGKLYWLSH